MIPWAFFSRFLLSSSKMDRNHSIGTSNGLYESAKAPLLKA
jgi:hypothetical protein